MSARVLLMLLFLPLQVAAQGYAGLGTAVDGFTEVTRPANLRFPRDHGPHPDFRIEWWYLTAALTGADGRDYGAQWTLFRVATTPGAEGAGWESNQIWIAHAGLTTSERQFSAERFARGGVGQAGVTAVPFTAWLDDWEMTGATADADALDAVRVTARGLDFAFTLEGAADGLIVLHGEAGFSLKSAGGQASYYYSQPFLRVAGAIEVDGSEVAVTGTAWIDREWSSQHLAPDQAGWDWFSLHLDDGSRLMAYRLRETEGPSAAFGTWIAADGAAQALGLGEIEMIPIGWAPVAGREMPVAWRLSVPGHGLAVDTAPVNAQSWMDGNFPYWEGPIRVTGSHAGRGYLEMTGY